MCAVVPVTYEGREIVSDRLSAQSSERTTNNDDNNNIACLISRVGYGEDCVYAVLPLTSKGREVVSDKLLAQSNQRTTNNDNNKIPCLISRVG